METYAPEDAAREYAGSTPVLGQKIKTTRSVDISEIRDRLERAINQVSELRYQARDVADALFGSQPDLSQVTKVPAVEAGPRSLAELTAELDRELDRLRQAIGRF